MKLVVSYVRLSEKDRNKFIKQMISDKKIDELLKETEELEK